MQIVHKCLRFGMGRVEKSKRMEDCDVKEKKKNRKMGTRKTVMLSKEYS